MQEQIKYRQYKALGNLQLLRATYITQSFPRHSHDEFVIGFIESGALRFNYRGSNQVVSKGSLYVVNPDMVHTGQADDESGWTFTTLYIDSALFQQVVCEATGQNKTPFFSELTLHDRRLVQLFLKLHFALERTNSLLECESRLLNFLVVLVASYADICQAVRLNGQESQSVRQVREYIEAHYAEKVLLEDLATLANLSKFHLLRAFSLEVGRPPHAYLEQIRINHAKHYF
ncbi:MAG: AraC family transcriptional regulator [Leptolyngbyaceae cyanobacterium SM1_4_3]|nr:AraC family transcriptional regulator [Leptolyngbyaceae cyanobacterium SM1_4_3]